jgi:hypothetical protein
MTKADIKKYKQIRDLLSSKLILTQTVTFIFSIRNTIHIQHQTYQLSKCFKHRKERMDGLKNQCESTKVNADFAIVC